MPLIDLQTNLKSLRYGADRLGGGDSGLPYIQKDIATAKPGIKFDDGFVRGGAVNAAVAGAIDTARIAKFLYTGTEGKLWIAKQVGLQLSNPRLEIPKNPANIISGLPDNPLAVGTRGLLEPTRIYNLGINTLAQVPVNAFGIHFNRHGLLPIQSDASKYEAVVTANNDVAESSRFNRLVSLTNKFKLGDRTPNQTISRRITGTLNAIIQGLNTATGASIPSINIAPQDLIIDQYAAGPNSVYGIGRTTINRYSNSEDGFKIGKSLNFSTTYAGKTRNQTTGAPQSVDYSKDKGTGPNSISTYPESKDEPTAVNQTAINYSLPVAGNPALKTYALVKNQIQTTNQKVAVYTHDKYEQGKLTGDISNLSTNYNYSDKAGSNFTIKTSTPGYSNYPVSTLPKHINKTNQSKVNYIGKTELGFAGTENVSGSINHNPINTIKEGKNLITAKPSDFTYYNGKNKISNFERTNDTDLEDDKMKLVFAPIQPFTGVETQFLFLGYLNSYDESYDSGWGDTRYVGRAESFYVFNSFKRTANISFTVPCFKKEQLVENHKKLFSLIKNDQGDYNVNHDEGSLAYALAGQYSGEALLGGVITRVTVGNYLNNTPGVINSLKFDIVDNSPWDLYEKLVQYLRITVSFTIIGDTLPVYEI